MGNPMKLYNYWLFFAPFACHLGWIVAASLVSINVRVLKYCAGSAEQVQNQPECVTSMLTSGVLSLCVILLVSFVSGTFSHPYRNPWIPGVASWALGAISAELSTPRDSIKENFTESYSG